MSTTTIEFPDVMPSATPTDQEIADWNALPRDEQVRRMKLALSHPDGQRESTATMDEIWARARAAAETRRHG
jgi:hypothetical protein